MPNQRKYGGQLSTRVPSNRLTALEQYAYQQSTPHETVKRSDLVRDAVDLFLAENWEDLPEEARDALDDDLKANAGGDADDPESLGGESK